MKQVYTFLKKLYANNNREWFQKHKDEYIHSQATFNQFVEQTIKEIHKFDKDINPDTLGVKECTYRIYRDVRFSKDKSPYKTHFGAYFVKGGKKSPFAGYYFHIEPFEDEYSSGNMMCVGSYMPDMRQILSVREEVMLNGDSFLKAIGKSKFELFEENSLRRTPSGYESVVDPELQRLLRLRQFLLVKQIDEEFLFAPDLPRRVALEFKRGYDFNQLINRCIEYALENSYKP